MAFSASPSALSAPLLSSPISLACSAPLIIPPPPLVSSGTLASSFTSSGPLLSVAAPLAPSAPSQLLSASFVPSFLSPHSQVPPSHIPLYSPTSGLSPSSLFPPPSSQPDLDTLLRELRSSLSFYMSRSHQQDELISTLTARSLRQDELISALTARIHTLSEEMTKFQAQMADQAERVQSRIQQLDAVPIVDPAIEERISTIQTEVQRHSEWVDVVRRAPPAQRVSVSEAVAETHRRSQRALNIRIRGIEKADTVSPMQQAVDFVTQTMGVQDHGIQTAYRAGRDPARHQPLVIRFRDAQARLEILRRRGRLRDHQHIWMDEDFTPLQWQEHRILLQQRAAALKEGKWAVIRDGRLITRPLRITCPLRTAQPV